MSRDGRAPTGAKNSRTQEVIESDLDFPPEWGASQCRAQAGPVTFTSEATETLQGKS